MPYISIRVAGELTKDQKSQIAADISKSIHKTTGKSEDSCYIVFDEVKRENWAKGAKLLD